METKPEQPKPEPQQKKVEQQKPEPQQPKTEQQKPEQQKPEQQKPEQQKPEHQKPEHQKSDKQHKPDHKAQQKQQKTTAKKEAVKHTVASNKAPVPPATTPPVEPPSPQPKVNPAQTTWASLVKKNEPVKSKIPAPNTTAASTVNGKQLSKPNKPNSPTPSSTPKFTGVAGKTNLYKAKKDVTKLYLFFADIISKYEPNYNAPILQPRGLINNVNTCFMNVVSNKSTKKKKKVCRLIHLTRFYNHYPIVHHFTIL